MADFKFEVWPTEYRQITQQFGANPQNYAQFGLPGHEGIDIKAPTGSRIFCVAPGEVIRVHRKATGHNYGIHVRVAHQDGYKTIYAHLQEARVNEGDIVEAGTVLGLADNTGNSFGSHLHLMLKKQGARVGNWPNNIIDPTPFLLPLLGWQEPPGPYVEGWILSYGIVTQGHLAQVNTGGATLRIDADQNVLVPAGTILIVKRYQRDSFTLANVPRAAVNMEVTVAPQPEPEPSPLIATVDGWAWKAYLSVAGDRAVVGLHGINLRIKPHRSAPNVGMVKAGSSVSIRGEANDRYLPIRVRRSDFMEPVSLPEPPPERVDVPGENGYLGWALTQYLSGREDKLAVVSRLGVNLRDKPDRNGQNIGLVKAFATIRFAGEPRNDYSPILVRKEDVLNGADPMPVIESPEPVPDESELPPPPVPIHDTTPGWVLTGNLQIFGDKAKTSIHGSNLRTAPRRNAELAGYIPPGIEVVVTGAPRGEYTPVRVDDAEIEAAREDSDDAEPGILGRARIGLHASADPTISEAEHQEFALMRPGIIKLLSFHSAVDIGRLAAAHPDAHWIVRAFLSFGGRQISPDQFMEDTLSDVRRALNQLRGRNVVVELHNEPNVVSEGLGSSWSDGASFAIWWAELLAMYRQALPGTRFLYPGLSPGSTVIGVKQDHIQFIEASRAAVEAADGLAVHLYWSNVYPAGRALNVLDDYISRFRSQAIWVTEASYNKGALSPGERAQQYLQFWRELQARPVVQGITYFVASASNPDFANEVWVGNGIGRLVGQR